MVSFAPAPHEEAIALISGKPVVTREVFAQLLPQLRARAFTITGIEGAHVVQRVRDEIAALPRGGEAGTWDKVKRNVVDELEPYLGDQSERRAEILIRTHGFQAFQASNWRVAQEDADTTHLQYLATEDERVRDSHLALNGLVIPKDDPFWDTHFPPWDWGCRCRTRAMNPDLVDLERESDAERDPDQQLVLEDPALDRLRQGQLQREGQTFDVTPPKERVGAGDTAYEFNPASLALPLRDVAGHYDPEVAAEFYAYAQPTEVAPGVTLIQAIAQPPQEVTRRIGAPIAQPSLAGEYPLGPVSPLEFGRERANLIRRLEKEAEQAARGEAPDLPARAEAAEAVWKPREIGAKEIEDQLAREAAFFKTHPLPTVESELDELRSGTIWTGHSESELRRIAELNVAEEHELVEHWARRAIYAREHPDGNRSPKIAAWSKEIVAEIHERFRKARAAILRVQ